MDKYTIFAPSVLLTGIPQKDWSNKQADDYFDWLMTTMDERLESMAKFLNIQLEYQSSNYAIAGKKIVSLINDCNEFIDQNKLTNSGYALAADMGLFVAKGLLLLGDGRIKFAVLKKPKTDASFNLPVLIGFGGQYFDPIGGSIAELASFPRGRDVSLSWQKIFDFWVNKI